MGNSLFDRAEAARQLLRADPGVDRYELLALVCWPTEAVARAEPRPQACLTEAELARMAALAASGLSHRQVGERVGRPRSTVSAALRRLEQPS
jgi:hypothetical protein